MPNKNLQAAKTAKNDEFYTHYLDIQKEVNAYLEYNPDVFRGKTVLLPCDDPEWSNFTKFFALHFEDFGLRKLISTSYAIESKKYKIDWQPTLFETENPNYDVDKSKIRGKIFTLTHDTNQNGRIDINDLEWQYLDGDGDFRSDEVRALRDEADIIVTNPPFSMFREFLAWIMEAEKKFLIIGNMNTLHYKDVFSLVKENKVWLGVVGGTKEYIIPEGGTKKMGNTGWFTNIDHGRRHQPMQLMTENENIKFSKHEEIKNHGYIHYDNLDAIDVPYIDAIPSDFNGIMGVPDNFLDRYCPEQFEIIGIGTGNLAKEIGVTKNYRGRTDIQYTKNGVAKCPYSRILIRKKQ